MGLNNDSDHAEEPLKTAHLQDILDGASGIRTHDLRLAKDAARYLRADQNPLVYRDFLPGSAFMCRGRLPEYTRIFRDLQERSGTECQNPAAALLREVGVDSKAALSREGARDHRFDPVD
jgi:hypothetical protein